MRSLRAVGLGSAMFAAAACATVAGVEVTRAPSDTGEEATLRRDDAAAAAATTPDTGGATSSPGVDSGAIPEGIACGCDAGQACCVGGATTAACVGPEATCVGLRLVCRQTSVDGRDCCWNDSDANKFESTSYRAGCGDKGRVACIEANDCLPYGGGACKTTVCAGVTIGVCVQGAAATPPSCN